MPTSPRVLSRPLTVAVIVAFAVAILPGPAARPVQAAGSISLTSSGTAYVQDFDTLASTGTSSTVPNGWDFVETGTNADLTYAAGTGSSNAGNTYSFGPAGSTDRAFGGLLSGSLVPTIGASFTNDTGGTIESMAIAYTGEQWRLGAIGRLDRIDFQYSLTATSLSTGTWIDVDALDFTAPNTGPTVGALDGNAAANRSARSSDITGLAIPAGATFWIRWTDFNATNADDGLGVDDFSLTPTTIVGDAAPTLLDSSPEDGDTNVDPNPALSLTFSEAVTFDVGAVVLSCGSPPVDQSATLAPTADPAVFELIVLPLPDGATCSIVITASKVHDADGDDPPDVMPADVTITFTVVSSDPCAGTFTPIYDIQGSGASTPFFGQQRTTEGVVTAVFPNLRGFAIQDPTGDADPATSDGIFVFRGPAFGTDTPAVGDDLRLTGRATEFQGQTELDNLTELVDCGDTTAPTATEVVLPETVNGELERYEGMLVTIPGTLTAQQNFFQGRFGQVTLASGGRLATPTNEFDAGSPDAIALADENQRRLIVLDDANSNQNPNPIPYIGEDDTLRAGDTTSGVTGMLDFGPINSNTSIRDYRIQPTQPVTFTRVNERPAEPADVGGLLKVASFNVLNYFNGDGLGGGFPTERGADTPLEFERQRDKIIAAIVELDADIVGLMEIEKDGSGPTSAIADLVDGLNEATAPGTYALISDPATGVAKPEEPIRTALIYQPGSVTPVGASRSDTDPSFERYPIAQTFSLDANGEVVTVIVNHFKSKGCADATGDDLDQGDGQGCYNATRVDEAHALLGFIGELIADIGDEDVLVIGDLNAYAQEDPIQVLLAGGLTDLLAAADPDAYTYVFDGQAGVLDHGLATASLVGETTGATIWHINADEPSIIDYNLEFKPQDLYAPHVFRSSDHDPVLLGIDLGRCAFEDDGTTRTLLGDCSTDETILVPDGWTLDGDGYTISAFDPAGDHFRGAVVANEGSVAHVTNLTVTAYQLADACDADADRLRGILLDGASGSVTDSRVIDLNQGASGCQEGNGIEARNAPFEPGGVDTNVTIAGNEVTGHQKTGILANGSVFATILDNVVVGEGPIGYIAQNGIQVGFGGTAFIRGNAVSGHHYTGPDVACGLLFFMADGVKQQANDLFDNEQDVCNFGRGGGNVKPGD